MDTTQNQLAQKAQTFVIEPFSKDEFTEEDALVAEKKAGKKRGRPRKDEALNGANSRITNAPKKKQLSNSSDPETCPQAHPKIKIVGRRVGRPSKEEQ